MLLSKCLFSESTSLFSFFSLHLHSLIIASDVAVYRVRDLARCRQQVSLYNCTVNVTPVTKEDFFPPYLIISHQQATLVLTQWIPLLYFSTQFINFFLTLMALAF